MHTDPVAAAYSSRAQEYIDAVGKIEYAAPQDREYVLSWAQEVRGPILDVGCGPGQWTDFLSRSGLNVEGVDPSEVFIAEAQKHYPSTKYRVGRAERLEAGEASVRGILAWYSLIHMEPGLIAHAFVEFARVLEPGGSLLLGFFEGEAREPFDHAVTTGYFWSQEALAECLETAGFTVVDAVVRQDPGVRPHGATIARRNVSLL